MELPYLRSRCAFTLVSLDICKCIFWNVWCDSRVHLVAGFKGTGRRKSCWALTVVAGSVVSWLCDLIWYNHYPHCPKPWPHTRRWIWSSKIKNMFCETLHLYVIILLLHNLLCLNLLWNYLIPFKSRV